MVLAPLQSNWLAGWFIVAVGFTVMVNVVVVPVQVIPPLVKVGVTVMVAVTGVLVPVLMAVNDGIVPVPLAPSPMEVLLLLQLYTVPATGPVIVTAVVAVPLHTVWLAITFTDGVGLTVIVKVLDVPVQVVPPLV